MTRPTYNAASQIVTARRNDGANAGTFAWPNYSAVSRTQTINALNQVTKTSSTVAPLTTSFGYDKNGNLTQSGSTHYCYDAENRLTASGSTATCGIPTASLAYDPSGRLQTVTAGSSTTNFAYDGLNMIAEYNGSTLADRYVFGPGADSPIVAYDGSGNRTWLYSDERGSIVAAANVARSVSYTNTYDEYGNPPLQGTTNLNSGRFQYTGQMWLSELGMYYYKARMYSPTMGRFLQTDPIGYEDNANAYAYVHNDPVNGGDPFGLDTYSSNFTDGANCIYDHDSESNEGLVLLEGKPITNLHCEGGGGYSDQTYYDAIMRYVAEHGWPEPLFDPHMFDGIDRELTNLQQSISGFGGSIGQSAKTAVCSVFSNNPNARGTFQLGLAGSGRAPLIGGYGAGFGLAIDRSGTIAFYGYGGKLVGTGLGGAVGISGQLSNARGVDGLRGPFLVSSVTGGDGWAGSADIFADPVNRDTAGGGFTLGGGGGYTVNGGVTDTGVWKLTNLSSDLGCR